MSGLEINTKKLAEIYKEWRGNESCYDNGRPVFEADELLDFAQFCLKHEANVAPTGERQSNIPDVIKSVCEFGLNPDNCIRKADTCFKCLPKQ